MPATVSTTGMPWRSANAASSDFGERVVHAATGDDERRLRLADRGGRGAELGTVRARPAELMDDRLEQAGREVVRLALHILGQREEGRSAVRRIEQRRDRLRQALHDLFGPGDAVPVAHDGPERIVGRRRRFAEALDLLQDRIGQAALERVAGQQQHGQPVDHRHAGRRDHVQCSGSDRAGGDHELAPAHRFGVGDRRQGHALLVLAAPRRQILARGVECRAEARHVAVPEDGEHTRDERHLRTVDDGPLGDEVADDRFGCRQSHRFHGDSRRSWTDSQRPDCQLRNIASCTLT